MALSRALAIVGSGLAAVVGTGCKDSVTPSAPITVTAVSPARDLLGGGSSVTVTGTNFINVISVTIGGSELGNRTVVSATQITGVTPAVTSPGAKDVVVTSSSHGSGTCRGCFTYTSLGVLANCWRPVSVIHAHSRVLARLTAGEGTGKASSVSAQQP